MIPTPKPAMTLAHAQEADTCRLCGYPLNVGESTPLRSDTESSHTDCLYTYMEGLAQEQEDREFRQTQKWKR